MSGILTKSLLNCSARANFQNAARNYMARRALLYVPGSDSRKVEKSFALDIDCICLDCEDGVALKQKVQARINIRDLLGKGKPQKNRKYDLALRVNGLNSGLLEDDLRVTLSGENTPDTILLPKVESPEDLHRFSDLLNEHSKSNKKIGLIVAIESANSLIKIVDICRKAKELEKAAKFHLVALLFGSDDFCASIGARRSSSSIEVLYARQKLVSVAKAFNLQAIDMVYINYKDIDGLKKQAEEGMRFGFTGKQVIHPGQVEPTQTTFMPTQKEIDWASGVLTAFHNHQQQGEGAFTFKDQMIDMPTMRQAQNIMDVVNAIMMQK